MTTKSVPSEQVAREWLQEREQSPLTGEGFAKDVAALTALLERTRDEARIEQRREDALIAAGFVDWANASKDAVLTSKHIARAIRAAKMKEEK